MKKIQVNYYSYETHAESPIDTITVADDYTVQNYIDDCMANMDEPWDFENGEISFEVISMERTLFGVEHVSFKLNSHMRNSDFTARYLAGKERLEIEEGFFIELFDTLEEAKANFEHDEKSYCWADLRNGAGVILEKITRTYHDLDDEDFDENDSDYYEDEVDEYIKEGNYFTNLKKKLFLNRYIDEDEWLEAHNVSDSDYEEYHSNLWDEETVRKYASEEEIEECFDVQYEE